VWIRSSRLASWGPSRTRSCVCGGVLGAQEVSEKSSPGRQVLSTLRPTSLLRRRDDVLTANRRGNPGRRNAPRNCVTRLRMNASDCTPASGESASGVIAGRSGWVTTWTSSWRSSRSGRSSSTRPAGQPPGGSESGERSEPVFASAVGPARATSDRQRRGRRRAERDGTPDDRAELVCGSGRGAVAVAGACYILHMRESNPPKPGERRQRRSAGGSR
jgi:hypothetical protein